ncbi:acetyl xylan esterase AXE1 [Winogradskyella wandonensis]|uniref:Acetyl xylan esterase AXE1 n=1 Tax=Winogradskyella wandonensis TaxID=1442586 RepID=A0A4R1KSB8_9FLAO|nr:alpha/beta fold hydrolase [Winogradskyella wandonensis]TCK67932.1 acetyl xylan esterase AXE1 [Winogradskyella wandonensis]
MTIEKNIVLKREKNKPILIDIYCKEGLKISPIVIFCHGYKGYKDWGAWDIMAKRIAKNGFCFIKFNFSHNGGTVEQPIDFPDLEAFGNNNYSKELNDLGDVIDWAITHFKDNSFVDTSRIYLIGHSRGGGIAILKAAEDNRIKKLVTLASVCDFGKRTATVGNLDQWKKDGVKYVTNGRTKQQMPHYYQFYEDYIQNKERLDIKKACQKIKIPQLIIHGNSDTSISIKEAESINNWNPKSQLEIIKNADHVFNISHPWPHDYISSEFEEVIKSTLDFLV